jgi:hypothetical protein
MQHVHNDAYTSNALRASTFPRVAKALVAIWLAAALLAVTSGTLGGAPVLVLPASVVGLTALTLAAVFSSRQGRDWVQTVSLGRLAWFHAWRLVPGAAFLVLHARGALPWGFAVPGGIGDMAIAVSAPVAAWAATHHGRAARASFVFWNALGLVDLASVVRAAFVLSRASPASMHLLRELPLGLLPTFAVPLTLAAHVVAFVALLLRSRVR